MELIIPKHLFRKEGQRATDLGRILDTCERTLEEAESGRCDEHGE